MQVEHEAETETETETNDNEEPSPPASSESALHSDEVLFHYISREQLEREVMVNPPSLVRLS
jgi:hypothetical protein